MKKIILSIGFLNLFFFTLNGCAPSTTVTKIYLQEVEVSGPINHSSVHITDNSESGITISPRIVINTNKSHHGKINDHTLVNAQGIFQVDTIF